MDMYSVTLRIIIPGADWSEIIDIGAISPVEAINKAMIKLSQSGSQINKLVAPIRLDTIVVSDVVNLGEYNKVLNDLSRGD